MRNQDDTITQQIAMLTPYQQAVLETAAYGIHQTLYQMDPSIALKFARALDMDGREPPRHEIAAAMYRWVHTHINDQPARK